MILYPDSDQSGSSGYHNQEGNKSNWSSIPDEAFLAKVFTEKVAKETVTGYYQALEQYLQQNTNPDADYFTVLDHKSRIELYLDNLIDFEQPLTPIATPDVPPAASRNKERSPLLSQEALIAELEQLIDENTPESKIQEIIPYLAKFAGLPTRDVQAIYAAKLAEQDVQAPEDLKKDLDELLAIGGESLNLFEYLPPPLAEPLLRLASRMAIRPEVFLLTLLTAISSLHKVGTNLTISAEDKFIVPPNLFSGIIAESGQKKSPVLRILVKYPLDALEREANEQLKLIHEQALEEWEDCPEDERKDQFPTGEPKEPTPIDYYFTEGTVEGINRQFSRFPDRGMLYLRDELAGVFAFDKYRNGRGSERQDFLSFYDGFGKKELRADGFSSRVKQLLLSIYGTIQPDILRRLMADPLAADGQWSRFLFVIQPLQPARLQRGTSYDINSELLNPLYRRIDRLPIMNYYLEADAADCYEKHYNQLEIKRTTHPDPAMRAVFSKMEGTIGRLAINLHVVYELLGRQDGKVSESIRKISIVQACKLAKFFINQIRLINAAVAADADQGEIAPHLVAIIERSRSVGAVDARGIRRSIHAFRNSTVQDVRAHFRQLAELGYGECNGVGSKMEFTAYK